MFYRRNNKTNVTQYLSLFTELLYEAAEMSV